jgi:predicted HicB family RNase H-like nuclease
VPDARPLKQFNVYLPPELIRAVKHHAVDTERSLSSIVQTALEEHLARPNPGPSATRRPRRSGGD